MKCLQNFKGKGKDFQPRILYPKYQSEGKTDIQKCKIYLELWKFISHIPYLRKLVEDVTSPPKQESKTQECCWTQKSGGPPQEKGKGKAQNDSDKKHPHGYTPQQVWRVNSLDQGRKTVLEGMSLRR